MIYKLIFLKSAVKDLKAVETPYQIIIKQKITQLSEDFESLKNNLKSLKGNKDLYRLRVGKYRVIFTKDDDKLLITVVRIGHRKNVYGK